MNTIENSLEYQQKCRQLVDLIQRQCVAFFKELGLSSLGKQFLDDCINECNVLYMQRDNPTTYIKEMNSYWSKPRENDNEKLFFGLLTSTYLINASGKFKAPFVVPSISKNIELFLQNVTSEEFVNILSNLPPTLLRNVSLVMSILFGSRENVVSTVFDTNTWESDSSHFLIGLLRSTDHPSNMKLYFGLVTFACCYMFYLIHFYQKMRITQQEWNRILELFSSNDGAKYPYKMFYIYIVEMATNIVGEYGKTPQPYLEVISMACNYIRHSFKIDNISRKMEVILRNCLAQKVDKQAPYYRETYGIELNLKFPLERIENKVPLMWLARLAGTSIFPLVMTGVLDV